MSIELFLGITGTIIALGVAITTIWQGVLTRRHNRLSVKPILRVTRITAEGREIEILLKNTGFGPAVISSVKFFVDDIVVEKKNLFTPGNLALQKIGVLESRFTEYEFNPQESLSAGEEQALFKSLDAINDEEHITRIIKGFDRLSIEIEYESIYGETFKMNNRCKAPNPQLKSTTLNIAALYNF